MSLDEDFLKEVASQLRKPTGDFGREVADKMNLSNHQMNIRTIELLDIADSETILEIGMANGAFVDQIVNSANNVKYVGVDYSPDMVALASSNNQHKVESGLAKFLKGDIKSLPFTINSFDKIFTVNTVYFWDDLDLAFKQVYRVLKTGGFFAIGIRPEGCMKKYPSTQYNFRYFDAPEIESFFEMHGFKLYSSIHETEPDTEVLDKFITPEFEVIVGKKM